jgi:hypothetical protein
MRFEDKNKTLVPPEGYTFRNAETDGAYMRLTYNQAVYKPDTLQVIGENVVTVYLNDQGREVGRTVGSVRYQIEEPKMLAPMPRKFRFKNAVLIILHGLREILKCCRSTN